MSIVSVEVRLLWRAAAGALLLGIFAAPHGSSAQPLFEPVAKDEQQRRIVDEIRDEQTENGPFSRGLIAPLRALGLLYREDGDPGLAIGAIEQARQVVRANYGLHSLEETPLLEQAIEANEAGRQFTTAWQLEQQLLELAERHLDDVRTAPILDHIGDKRMAILARYLGGELPPQIVLGCYYADPRFYPEGSGKCTSGSRDMVIARLLWQARSYYTTAIDTLVRNGRFASPELHDLEMKVLRNSYAACQPGVAWCAGYEAGRESYRRLMSYNTANGASWLTRVETAVELADWDLVFSQHQGTIALDGVLDVYDQARRLLAQKGVEQASIDALFSPRVPIAIPTIVAKALVTQRTPQSTGYVDVAFRITKYGRSQRVKVLETTLNATNAEQDRIVRAIRTTRFRPLLVDGGYPDFVPVVARYFVND
jgi:hypothetical protein